MAMIESLKSAKNGQIGPIFFLSHKFAVNFLSGSCVYPKKMLFLRAYYVMVQRVLHYARVEYKLKDRL